MSKASGLTAGAAAVDITPLDYRNTYLAGFMPNRKAVGVLDPLYARIVYLNDGHTELVIASLDLIGVLHPVLRKIREKVGVVDPDNIVICSTHTHSGPDTIGLWGPSVGVLPYGSGVDKNYMQQLEQALVHGIRKAKKRAVPAKIGFAQDNSEKSELTWNVRQRSFMDHALTIFRVDPIEGGRSIATLTNYASHPESLWEMNKRISPDWPVALHRTIERTFGGVSIFVNGALGGMVTPGIDEDAPLPARESFYLDYGNAIAKIAQKMARQAKFTDDPEIVVRLEDTRFSLKNDKLSFAAGLGLVQRETEYDGVTSQVGHIRIGPAHIATTPGELTPAVGLAVRREMYGEPNFLFCLANDEIGYVLTQSVFHDSLFDYERSMSLGPETAGTIIDTYERIAK